MKFRLRPILIEADQWQSGHHVPGVKYLRERIIDDDLDHPRVEREGPYLSHGDEGDSQISPGDWIITEKSGRRWVCSNATFVANYEPVD